jgi:regulator of replication initiation timing
LNTETNKKTVQAAPMSPALLTELATFELRVNDLKVQYVRVVKLIVEENAALRQEVAELKSKLEPKK